MPASDAAIGHALQSLVWVGDMPLQCVMSMHMLTYVQAVMELPLDVHVAADPQRASGLTFAAQQRQAEQAQSELAPRDSGFIRHVKGRATPAWRKRLS